MGVTAIERSSGGSVSGVRLDDGSVVPADIVVEAIGVVPNTNWLEGSPIDRSAAGAIETDDALRTNAKNVFAAGDCANVTWPDGSRRPEQLWYTARDQGRVAGTSMAGHAGVYRRGPTYNSAKFFDIEWTTVGDLPALKEIDGSPASVPTDVRTWFQQSPATSVSHRVVCRGDQVIGFNFLGTRFDHEPLLQWIAEGRTLDYVLARLSQAQFDEEFSEPFVVRPDAQITTGCP